MQQSTSLADCVSDDRAEEGFTLLEVVCVLAIVSMVLTIALPALPRGTSKARLESYALATAALLKSDRSAALRRQIQVATEIDLQSRTLRSGANGRTLQLPDDVVLNTLLSARCGQAWGRLGILFFSSGMSCGGVILLTRSDISYEVRVNWLTGGIEVAAASAS